MSKKRILSHIVKLLNQAEKAFFFDKKRAYYLKALRISKTNREQKYTPNIYIALIQLYFHKDLYTKALFYINLGKKYYRDTLYFFYFISARATVYIYNNQFYEARKLLLCFYREQRERIFPEIFTQLSEIALGENRVKKAIYYAHKSLEASGEKYELEEAYVNLIDLYREQKMFDEAHYYLQEAKDLAILRGFHYSFLQYNILVKQERYEEAEKRLKRVEKDLEDFPEFKNSVTAITLELFKKTNNRERFMETFKRAKRLNRDEIAMLWLIYDQAGEFYQQRGEFRKALNYYRLSASQLERHRKNSNINSDDKLDFFRDKYHYLLDYTLFAESINHTLNALCFFELSKSSSLKDAIFVNSLNHQEIKGYM